METTRRTRMAARRASATILTLMLTLVLTSAPAAASLPAQAADTGTDPSMVIEKLHQSYVVNRDGSYLMTDEQVRRIVLERAVPEQSQITISYNKSLDEIVAISAYTEKPDGRRVPLGAEQIKDQQEAASADAPLFQDTRVKVLVFPDVAVGDRLVFQYQMQRHTALFPGQFEDLSTGSFFRNDDFLLSYDLPDDMPLYADADGFEALPDERAHGRKRYQWRYVAGPNARIESGAVNYLDYGKRLAVSTFADYAAFARAYQARARDKALPDAAITALALRLTADTPDMRGKALALANWVRRHIRYVGVYIGPGGVVPHPAPDVLAQRYGDCKDHAVLLEALLGAVGLPSTAALINGADVYRLPAVPTLGVFSHVINYVPSLGLFLDSTADSVAAGFLPGQDLGKPVLLVESGALSRTPESQADVSRNRLRFDVASGGSSQLHITKVIIGTQAEPFRQAVRDAKQADRERYVERLLQGYGQRGAGQFDPGRLDGPDDEYQMGFSGLSEDFANLPGPTGVRTSYDVWGSVGYKVSAYLDEKTRLQDFACPGFDEEEQADFHFAAGLRILAVPRQLNLRDGALAYQADYVRKGNLVTVRRHLRFAPPRAVCTPDDYLRMRPLLERMRRDLKNQIIIEADAR